MSVVNSLANFGVIHENGNRYSVLQPIFSTHFRATVYNFGDAANNEASLVDFTRQIKQVSLPSMTFETVSLPSYVSIAYVTSRGQWEEGTMTFRDDITSGVRGLIDEQISRQKNVNDQTMPLAGNEYKFEMDVDVLTGGAGAGNSSVLRKYCYAGCMLTSIDDTEMQYENANPKDITVRFRYDNALTFKYNGNLLSDYRHRSGVGVDFSQGFQSALTSIGTYAINSVVSAAVNRGVSSFINDVF